MYKIKLFTLRKLVLKKFRKDWRKQNNYETNRKCKAYLASIREDTHFFSGQTTKILPPPLMA